MPLIELRTEINAAQQIVFDLSRSIDLHKISTIQTKEEAVAGRTSGLISLGERVTWRARHFGFYQLLTVAITSFDYPDYFVDEMEKGAFEWFIHKHIFTEKAGITVMTDIFEYRSPLGFLGKIADYLFLKSYMTDLLVKRNAIIKDFAETDKWQQLKGL